MYACPARSPLDRRLACMHPKDATCTKGRKSHALQNCCNSSKKSMIQARKTLAPPRSSCSHTCKHIRPLCLALGGFRMGGASVVRACIDRLVRHGKGRALVVHHHAMRRRLVHTRLRKRLRVVQEAPRRLREALHERNAARVFVWRQGYASERDRHRLLDACAQL
jgi:hypothetical protein